MDTVNINSNTGGSAQGGTIRLQVENDELRQLVASAAKQVPKPSPFSCHCLLRLPDTSLICNIVGKMTAGCHKERKRPFARLPAKAETVISARRASSSREVS